MEDKQFVGFDDQAEREREEAVRAAQTEKDALLPPDPEAILEVRHFVDLESGRRRLH